MILDSNVSFLVILTHSVSILQVHLAEIILEFLIVGLALLLNGPMGEHVFNRVHLWSVCFGALLLVGRFGADEALGLQHLQKL